MTPKQLASCESPEQDGLLQEAMVFDIKELENIQWHVAEIAEHTSTLILARCGNDYEGRSLPLRCHASE